MGFTASLKKFAPKLIVFVVIITIGITSLILSSIALSNVKNGRKDAKDSGDDVDEDLYKKAITNLNITLGIGWSIVGLTILGAILAFVFGGDVAIAATGAAEEALGGAKELESVISNVKELKKATDNVLDKSRVFMV
jgi:hypothetical protein